MPSLGTYHGVWNWDSAFLSSASAPHLSYTRRKQSLTGLGYAVWTSHNLTDWTTDTTASQSATDIPGMDNESVEVTLSVPRALRAEIPANP